MTSYTSRDVRSSVAEEAEALLYSGWGADVLEHIAGNSTRAAVANLSAGNSDVDLACLGTDARSRAANAAFEAGTLLFKSAGNQGHVSATDCTVTSPGAAIGVFTVGGLGEGSDGTSPVVRSAEIADFSSRGGTVSQGNGRTVVDLTAYACQRHMHDSDGGYLRDACGTSYAAPVVASAAVGFVDWYKDKDNVSNSIDNPAYLYTALLLMGDRVQDGTTARRTSGFHNLYGGGRLKTRVFDHEGMDGPWAYAMGSTCIEHGEIHTVEINGGSALSADVNVLYAVAYWYDAGHQSTGSTDVIDLEIRGTGGTLRVSDYSNDNKKRVVDDDPGGRALELRINGWNVTSSDSGCGVNQMRVYYAYYFEDSDRDDQDGPGAEVEVEPG